MLTCPPDIGTGDMLEFSWMKGEVYRQETFYSRINNQHTS
jgi:hypothetical protein